MESATGAAQAATTVVVVPVAMYCRLPANATSASSSFSFSDACPSLLSPTDSRRIDDDSPASIYAGECTM